MIKRRTFIKSSGIVAATLALNNMPVLSKSLTLIEYEFSSKRPLLKERKFVSEAVEKIILEAKSKIKDPELAWLFENCFQNTLDTTVTTTLKDGKPNTYVITGDINAMWLDTPLLKYGRIYH